MSLVAGFRYNVVEFPSVFVRKKKIRTYYEGLYIYSLNITTTQSARVIFSEILDLLLLVTRNASTIRP